MSRKTSFACCEMRPDRDVAIRFHRVGSYDEFDRLLKQFKGIFPTRYWDKDCWVIPGSQLKRFREFCLWHGLEIQWQESKPQQLSLWSK